MLPWVSRPVIDLDLDQPVEARYAALPPEVLADGATLLSEVMQQIPPAAKPLADLVRTRTHGRFHAEACAIAGLVNHDWRSVMLANISYDLALSSVGCSTVALPTPSGPVIARNMDWSPEETLARTSYVIRYHRKGRLKFAQAGWPGSIGVVSGLSARGFGVVLNAVSSPEGVNKTGYPVLLHIRRVLEDAEGFDAAVEMLSTEHLAASCLLTVAGTHDDQRVVIERSPRRHAHRRAEPGKPLLATNSYRKLFSQTNSPDLQLDDTSCSRYDALARLVADFSPEADAKDAALLFALTDPEVIQEITAQHVIIRPNANEISLFVPRRLARNGESA